MKQNVVLFIALFTTIILQASEADGPTLSALMERIEQLEAEQLRMKQASQEQKKEVMRLVIENSVLRVSVTTLARYLEITNRDTGEEYNLTSEATESILQETQPAPSFSKLKRRLHNQQVATALLIGNLEQALDIKAKRKVEAIDKSGYITRMTMTHTNIIPEISARILELERQIKELQNDLPK